MSRTTPEQPRSLVRRALGFIFFVLVPLTLLVASAWLGQDFFSALATRFSEQRAYRSELGTYEAEATAAAQQGAQGSQIMLMSGRSQSLPTATPQAVAQDIPLATNTPRSELQVTIPAPNTSVPAQLAATATIPAVEPLTLPTLIFPEDPSADIVAAQPTAVPARIDPIQRDYDLVNIVLLGSDEEITADNTIRTDTMIIVSINRDTGTVNTLSLPRDLFVYVPQLGMRRINVAFGWGEAVGWTAGGFGLLRDTLIYNLGINVHYYAKVNISELEAVIDLVDGVEVAVDCNYQDYQLVGAEVPEGAVVADEEALLYTLPVGYYDFSGAEAVWYARTRKNSTDFDRGRRQQRLIKAILRKALDSGQVAQLPALWSEGMEVVETNITLNEALSLLPVAIALETSDIESFTLIPTYHTQSWTTPDAQNVQLPTYDTLLPYLTDFYTPPSPDRVAVRGSTVRVFNGTNRPGLDEVAADVLREAGFSAYSAGVAPQQDRETTQVVDFTGDSKGGYTTELVQALGINTDSVSTQPDPNRLSDFTVTVGSSYDPCPGGVLPLEESEG